MPIERLAEAERWLDGLINRERLPSAPYARYGLEAIEALLALVGNPEHSLSVVHIAGSKGKGSTALLTEALLRALGERTGVFTSPHLVRWTERFRIDGREVEGDRLVRAVAKLEVHVEALRKDDSRDPPSFFDATTAAALLLFAEAEVDRVVLEVGLGGRLDSTNAVSPAVTCVTTIEYEHTDKLGETLAEIAHEKAGILKAGAPCVMGMLPTEAADVVLARAAALGTQVQQAGTDFAVRASGPSTPGGSTPISFSASDGFSFDAVLAPLGEHQLANAGVAVAAVRALSTYEDAQIAEAARRAFSEVTLPARTEIIERDPWVVIDAAHTRESARALRAFLDTLGNQPVHFVLSVSGDKALDALLETLLPSDAVSRGDRVTVTRAEPIRAAAPSDIAARVVAVRPGLTVAVEEDPSTAVRRAREALAADSLLCVSGSIYLAGIAREVLIQP